jgi:PPM family protein phosphatase
MLLATTPTKFLSFYVLFLEKEGHSMTITMKNASQTAAATISLTFVYSSVPHEGHPYYNDDTVLLDKRRGLAAVFDGVGSGPGQLASRAAARVIRRFWKRVHAQPELLALPTGLELEDLLPQMFEEAHQQIILEGVRRVKNLQGIMRYPATTAALALFCQLEDDHGYRMYYAHVGDSRIYLWRPDEPLKRLTDDDGFLSLRVLDGSVTPEDALRIDQAELDTDLDDVERGYFDNRNGITQALGHDKPLETHLGQVDILPGDRVLICSDGIHDNLTDQTLAQLLETSSRTGAAKKIIQQAIDQSHQLSSSQIRSKSDDMSAIVITCNTSR